MGKRLIAGLVIAFLTPCLAEMAAAQTAVGASSASSAASDQSVRLARLEEQAADAKSSADHGLDAHQRTGAEWSRNGKPSTLGAISGAVAGLVAITPAAGFVSPMPALLIGLIAGVFCYWMVAKVKAKFGYDDSLDAFGVHGAGGTLGALLTGVFASSAVNPIFKDAQGNTLASGVLEGNAHQLLNQLVGVAIAWGLAIVGTLLILKLVDITIGLRVREEEEVQGLDLSQHGEEGYYWEASA
jgi:Amt family ammonium transporter